MILSIDIGNTNITIALIDNNKILRFFRYETGKNMDNDYHYSHVRSVVKNKTKIEGVIISSVVPEVTQKLFDACKELIDKEPVIVSSDLNTGLNIKYDDPRKLGADLIAGAVGAVKKYGYPVIMIDIGTATTFSVINENKDYLGGMIASGPYTALKALAHKASLLPNKGIEPIDKIIGTNTIDCMCIGTFTAHAAMIDGMIERIVENVELGDVKIVATGGPAADITKMCKHKIICDADLLHYGMYELYLMNKVT